jgi:hypothetical protein
MAGLYDDSTLKFALDRDTMLSTGTFLRSVLVTATLLGAACCTTAPEPRPPPPRAKPAGAGVVVAAPTVRVASGQPCPADASTAIALRFASAASGALGNAGFKVVPEGTAAPYAAGLDIEVSYCSEAGIISGTTALELKKDGAPIWRSQASGDQANGDTAASTLNELIDKMLGDPAVIAAVGH